MVGCQGRMKCLSEATGGEAKQCRSKQVSAFHYLVFDNQDKEKYGALKNIF